MKKHILSLILFFSFLNQNIAQMLYDKVSMPGATFYFSDKPFTNDHNSAKTTFKSSDFIYGRLELNGKTLKEAFQLDNIKQGSHYLYYQVVSYKNNQQTGSTNRLWNVILIKENQLNDKWLNFDVLPEPSKASSKIGRANQGVGEFDNVAPAPLYAIMKSETFPANDSYVIYTQFHLPIRDGWGNLIDDNKWPLAEGSFAFDFNSKDVAAIQNNESAARERLNTTIIDKLPDCFTNVIKISDASVAVDKVTPVIKNYLHDYEVLKVAIEPAESIWSIVKNEEGLVSYRYVTGYYRIVYKKDGQCQLGSIRIIQDYVGNGKYGNSYCKFWGDEGVLDCKKLK